MLLASSTKRKEGTLARYHTSVKLNDRRAKNNLSSGYD
jgi:hypothetical protein